MAQFAPKLHNEVYPFIHPSKFKASLRGKVTLITGATGTIGQALTESFSISGANLIVVYNRTKPSVDFLNRCRTLGAADITPIQCNVSDFNSCQKLIKEVESTVGKIDILINNAGVDSIGPVCFQPHPNSGVANTARCIQKTPQLSSKTWLSICMVPYF